MEKTTPRVFNGIPVPVGEKITFKDGKPVTPSRPIIPFIEGDGIGTDIWPAARKILEAAIRGAYGDTRSIAWLEILAGDKARAYSGTTEGLPQDTLDAITEFGVAIKGPLGTPTGGGARSLNVTMRQKFDLYQCVRPVRYFKGVPSVVVAPEKLNVVIFRENTEDVYAGIEYKAETERARELIATLDKWGAGPIRDDTGIGIKIISRFGSKRLARRAIQYAIDHGRKVVTLVHKGNIQKFTEGAFCAWGYEVGKEEFRDFIVTEEELWSTHGGKMPEGKILLNDRIADAMFFEVLTKPSEFSVIATTNLNGDYLSDACAAQVGGLGIAPGANIGDQCALFEATHGTAPRMAGKNQANPSSLLLSGVLMLEYLGWKDAADRIVSALEKTIASRSVTVDLHMLMEGSTLCSTSEFADAVIANMPEPAKVEVAATASVADSATATPEAPVASVAGKAVATPEAPIASAVASAAEPVASVAPTVAPEVAVTPAPEAASAETPAAAAASPTATDGGASKTDAK
mgnify:CR=1 FL=1